MSQDDHDALSALLDGEPVEASELLAALEGPGALETLRDFVRLRLAVTAQEDATEGARSCPTQLPRATSGPHPHRWIWRGALAAAALLMTAALVPLVTHRDSPAIEAPEPALRPPTASRVLTFEVGTEWKEVIR